MAGVLIAMRWRVLTHSLNGSRATDMILGGLVGLFLAAGTIWLAATDAVPDTVRGELLAVVLAAWAVGWLLGPVYTGGGDAGLRPEQFGLLPLRPLRLAFGLLAAGFVGIAPIVSLIAFLSLAVHAAAQGAAAVLVAALAVPLQVVLVVAFSRLVLVLLSVAVRSRTGAIMAALVNAGITVLLNQSWVLIWAAVQSDLLSQGFPRLLATVLDCLPSSWALIAIDAAARGDWPVTVAALTGVLAAIATALLIWSRLMLRRTTVRPSSTRLLPTPSLGDGPVAVVATKELQTWSRDLMRLHLFFYSLFFGVLYTLIPLLANWWGMLPWTGLIVIAMAAGTSANLFGLDGTALWLNLTGPGNERAEIRGRQLAWLVQVAPVTVALTVIGTLLGGDTWTWPWVLGPLAAMLGGGAGLVVLASVYALVPMLEPKQRGGNPLEAGPVLGPVLGVLSLVVLTAAPAAVVAWAGTAAGRPWLTWLAVPTGIATGVGIAIWGAWQAERRLHATGPELLNAMRSGTPVEIPVPGRTGSGPAPVLPKPLQTLVTSLWIFCWLPLFPQGLVPLAMIFNGSDTRVWFLALYAEDPWRVPIAVAFIALGLAMLTAAVLIPRRAGTATPAAPAEDAKAGDRIPAG